jgi:hypothetical protein
VPSNKRRNVINQACLMADTFVRHPYAMKRIDVMVYNGIMTLPRRYAVCEGLLNNRQPLPIRNEWFEFGLAGTGSRLSADDCAVLGEGCDMGDGWCCFREPGDVNAAGCRLKLYTDAASGVEVDESIIRLCGLNGSGNPIRTTVGGIIQFGEAVDLTGAAGTVTTTNSYTTLTKAIKPNTNGIISVFAIDPDDANPATNEHKIAEYEPSEKLPTYRRYKVPKGPNGDDPYAAVAWCRTRYVAAELDNDPVCIENFNALYYWTLWVDRRNALDKEGTQDAFNWAMKIMGAESEKFQPSNQQQPMFLNMDELESWPSSPGM